jgi:hypothetical protein
MTADFRALCAELTEFVGRLTSHYYEPAELLTRARATRRPKPPSLAKQAIAELQSHRTELRSLGRGFYSPAIDAALERLQQLEQENND